LAGDGKARPVERSEVIHASSSDIAKIFKIVYTGPDAERFELLGA
jgi:hypothetical protein